MVSGGCKSKIRVSVELVPGEASFLSLQITTFLLCPHMAFPLCASLGLLSFFFFLIFKILFYLFIFGCVGVFVAAHGLSLVAWSGSCSSLWCTGLSLWWLLLLWRTGSRHVGFSSCGTRAQ